MMRLLNRLLNFLGDLVIAPWRFESAWPALVVASFVTALVMVGLFHLSADQPGMRRARNRLIARVLELLLYRHDTLVSLTACGRILIANAAYLGQLVRPVAVALVPTALLFIQLACWFEYRPFRPQERVLVEVVGNPNASSALSSATLMASENLTVETEGVRIPSRHEVSWRLRAGEPGAGWVDVHVGDAVYRKQIAVDRRLAKVDARRPHAGLWQQLIHPLEPHLPRRSEITHIDVRYPARELLLGTWEVHWAMAAVVLMMAFGLVLGWMFGVTIA